MITLKIFHVNAFSSEDFKGNPAGVVPMDFWISDNLMQKIANQNGLSETAFFVKTTRGFHIRWFTPEIEVDLCGHATLASAYVLLEFLNHPDQKIIFESKSGDLKVQKIDNKYYLTLPSYEPNEIELDFPFQKALGATPVFVFKAHDDILAVFNTEEEVQNIKPDFNQIAKLKSRGLIVTAPGNTVDFVSRFFAPNVGINEDSATGSIYTKLLPYWAKVLSKSTFHSYQISERSGEIFGEVKEGQAVIGGEVLAYLSGEIFIKNYV